MKVLIVYPEIPGFVHKSAGTSIIGGVVNSLGHQVDLFDTSLYDQERINKLHHRPELRENRPLSWFPKSKVQLPRSATAGVEVVQAFNQRLAEYNPDVIFVSATYLRYELGRTLIEVSDARDSLTIYGGIHCTTSPEMAMAPKSVKYIHLGEGEASIPEILSRVEQGQSLDDCPNLWVRMDDGSIRKNPLLPLVREMDPLPFYYWDFYQDEHFNRIYQGKVYRAGDYMIARGCPNKCTYCFNRQFFERYDSPRLLRMYSVDRAIEELVHLKERHNIGFIKFQDSDFLNKSHPYFREFAKKYAEHVGLPNTGGACVGSVSEEKSRLMVAMNTRSMGLGFESGDQAMRDEVLERQKYSNAFFKKTVHRMEEHGIRVTLAVMIGLPDEDRERIFSTIKASRESGSEHADFHLFFPFPNLKLSEYAIQTGQLDPETKVEEYAFGVESALKLKIPKDELYGLLRTCMLYMRLPYWLWPLIRLSERNTKDGLLWRFLRKLYFLRLQNLHFGGWRRERRRARTQREALAELGVTNPAPETVAPL